MRQAQASSSVCLSLTLCIVAKRCVLEQKLLLTGSHIWEIDWYQSEWPWPLFRGGMKVISTIVLHLTLNILETVIDRGLVPKDHQQEMAYGLSNGHVTDDVTWPWKVKLMTQICLERNISKTAGFRDTIQRTTNRKWPMAYQMVTWLMTSRDPEGAVR